MQSPVLIPSNHRVADSQDSQRFQVEPRPWGRVLPVDHPLFATPKAVTAMYGGRAEQVKELQEVA
jgi:hypothetical protein